MRIVMCDPSDLIPHPLSFELFGELSEDRIGDLVADIKEKGLRHPLELDAHRRVICGSQRLRAITMLGWTETPALQHEELQEEEEICEYLVKDNILRRQLLPSQMYKAGRELERIYSTQAELRQKQGGKVGGTGRTRDHVARDLDTSASHYERLKLIFESGSQVLQDKVDRSEISIHAAAQALSDKRMEAEVLEDDDVRAQLLKYKRFRARVDKFKVVASRALQDDYGPYSEDVVVVLKELNAEMFKP